MKKQQTTRTYKRCYDHQEINLGQKNHESLTNQLYGLPYPRQALNFPVSRVDFLFIIGERILSPAHDKKEGRVALLAG